jgi:hypothetical protein
MYAPRAKPREPELVSRTCACLKQGLTPICFLEAHKRMCEPLDTSPRHIFPGQVAYCPNALSIFDRKLPLNQQEQVRIRSWDEIKQPEQLEQALGLLYWYRKFGTKRMRTNLSILADWGIRRAKEAVKQTIHTLDGLIIKKLFAFGDGIVGYRELAAQTAELFGELLSDHIKDYKFEDPRTTFGELKPFFKMVKQSFLAENRAVRDLFLEHRFRSNALNRFFRTEFRTVSARIITNSLKGIDYTETLPWIYRMQYITQTRNLGHLPRAEVLHKVDKYLSYVGRESEPHDIKREKLIYLSAKRSLVTVQKGIFTKKAKAAEVMSASDEPVMPTASVDHTRSAGGKPEDARLLLTSRIGTEYTIYDLFTGDVKETRIVTNSAADYKVELFWLAIEALLDERAGKGKQDMFTGIYVGINEPGKLRSLIKMKAILAWALNPAAKMCAEVLSLDPMHYQGFKGSNHGWAYFRRLMKNSGESAFMYDGKGRTFEDLRQVFQDWTQASDGIPKRKGLAMLKGFFDATAFPKWYGRLVLWALAQPLEIKAGSIWFDSQTKEEAPCKTTMKEGFPMGMPMTKIILHLCHSVTRNLTIELLKTRGIRVAANKYRTPEKGLKYAKNIADLTVWNTGLV